jgi:glycosyltransferase involved in cell wall biosynthesis
LPAKKINLCVIIPVYNHPDKLDYLVERLSKLNLAIIMIDDGSNAECRQTIKRLEKENSNVRVQTHLVNIGKGAAIKTGINMAQKAGFSHALQIDADAQHDLNDIPRFIESMKKHPDALIAGYPLYDETIPMNRYFGRYATHIWVWINTLSMSIKDSMCGFRIYPVPQSWQLINEEKPGDRMEYDIEFIVRWYWTGQPLVQIPTKVTYPEHGLSHFRLVYDNCLISWMHARLFFGMLLRLPGLLKNRRKDL